MTKDEWRIEFWERDPNTHYQTKWRDKHKDIYHRFMIPFFFFLALLLSFFYGTTYMKRFFTAIFSFYRTYIGRFINIILSLSCSADLVSIKIQWQGSRISCHHSAAAAATSFCLWWISRGCHVSSQQAVAENSHWHATKAIILFVANLEW